MENDNEIAFWFQQADIKAPWVEAVLAKYYGLLAKIAHEVLGKFYNLPLTVDDLHMMQYCVVYESLAIFSSAYNRSFRSFLTERYR